MPPILNPILKWEEGGGKGLLVWESFEKRGWEWGELNCRLLFLNHNRQRCFQSRKQEVNYELCGETSKHLSHPHWILPHGVTEWIPLNYLTGDVWRSGKKRKKHHKHFSSVQDRYMFCCPVFSPSACHFSQSFKLGLTEQIPCLLRKSFSKNRYKKPRRNSH